jgi:hypothetical protein
MTRADARKQGRAKFTLREYSKKGLFRTCSSSRVERKDSRGPQSGTIDTLPPSEPTNGKMGAWRVNFINPAADETSAQLIAAAQERELKWKENCPAVL